MPEEATAAPQIWHDPTPKSVAARAMFSMMHEAFDQPQSMSLFVITVRCMAATISAEEIKEIRTFYGLTQRSFAALLGIGEASIARYETGATPSKANANLIRAAKNPRFILECLERDGDEIPTSQRTKAEQVIYASISLEPEQHKTIAPEEDKPMDATQLYHYVLQQEVLNEQAANIIASLLHYMVARDIKAGDQTDPVSMLLDELFDVKGTIATKETRDNAVLEQIRGYLKYTEHYVNALCLSEKVA